LCAGFICNVGLPLRAQRSLPRSLPLNFTNWLCLATKSGVTMDLQIWNIYHSITATVTGPIYKLQCVWGGITD
jgi:galactitol-specific phosphotransferase system IIC component